MHRNLINYIDIKDFVDLLDQHINELMGNNPDIPEDKKPSILLFTALRENFLFNLELENKIINLQTTIESIENKLSNTFR